jgi:tRNA(fMet)-specific endonuclease VapC
MKYLLDTDTCILILRQRHPVLGRYLQESPDDVAISAMTEAELRFGALHSAQPAANLARVEAFQAPLALLYFDGASARCHAELRLALLSKPIGERDLVIAAVGVANGLVMVTHNTREFGRVPGLAVEDWA